MGHRHSKDEILSGALSTAFDSGLSQLTFGRVAKHLGINDRTVVYYFPTKADLIGDVLGALAEQLLETLGAAFTTPAADHREVLRVAWPILTEPESERVFALFFEASGLAAANREPFAGVVRQIVAGWVDWTAEFIEGTAAYRRAEAETAVAVIDGLLLLRQLAGTDAAARAAANLGIA